MSKCEKVTKQVKTLKTKVLIVGGGPAGATAARYLAAAGIDTLLVERDFNYAKPCAGGIPYTGFLEFALPESLIRKRINTISVVSPSDRKIELKKDTCFTERVSLHQTMRNMAAEQGASIMEASFIGFGERTGATISSLVRKKDDGRIVEVQSDYVLACDGVNSSIGRGCGIEGQPLIYMLSAQVNIPNGDICEMWLGREHAGRFYSSVFPSDQSVRIGVGGENPHALPAMMDVFTRRRFGSSLKQLQEGHLIGKTTIFPIPVWRGDIYRSDNILFLGDAAGMVMPITGEGIYYAMKSGQFAAQAIIQQDADLYRHLWEKAFKNQFSDMKEIDALMFQGDEAIEKYFRIFKYDRKRQMIGARVSAQEQRWQESGIPSNEIKIPLAGRIAKDSAPKIQETPVADVRQVWGVLVFTQRQPENPQMLLQQIIDQQRAAGFVIAPQAIVKAGTVKDINDKTLISAVLRREFPEADSKELFKNTVVQSFRTPEGNEGKCCIVYGGPAVMPRKGTNRNGAFDDMMLIITEGCNLRCSYCYENEKAYGSSNEMSWATAKKAVDLFFSQVPAGIKRTNMSFFGGEPVLAFPLMKKIIEYSYGHRTIGGYTGGNYNYIINSNGTILTDEMFEFYKKLGKKLNIRVSVDGYKEKHDFSRRTKEGQGSWSLLEKNLPRFRELKEKYKVNVYLVSMINKSTCRDIYYNYKNLHELMGMRIYSQFIHEENWNNDDYRAIKEQIMLLHDYCVQQKMPVFCNLCDTGSGQKANSSINKDAFRSVCNAGIGSFTVNHAGDIFSCHRAYYYGMDEPFKIGNVDNGFDGTRIKLVREINNLNKRPAKCHECLPAIRNRCHLCIPSNNKAYGDFYVMPEGYCALMKEVHNELVEREKRLKQCA